ncbi:MAG: pyridoxamine 5'-phosphate oxidase family protein [Hyphomicrobiaceae bacterium]
MSNRITTLEELEAIYGQPVPSSLVKELDHIVPPYRALIEASPFVALASIGPGVLGCSPRGDPAGFVRIADEKTLHLPDRRGNNRIDTLRNIVTDPRVSLLFLIPGVCETLRINGRATLLTDPDLLASFEMQGKAPRSVISVTVERIYFQCQKALRRSRLWDEETQIDRKSLPSAGDILKFVSNGDFDGAAYDVAYPARLKETIY